MYTRFILLCLLLYCSLQAFSQQTGRKSIRATRTENPPKIDGYLNDSSWDEAEIANNFSVYTPNNGAPIPSEYATEVRVLYNDNAVYISAKLLDPSPGQIPKEFAQRDNRGQSDYFSVTINPNDDGQNPYRYYVEASGNQLDSKVANKDEDFNWSAVWESQVKITDYGWNVEMKIPYRALRFSNTPIQSWAFNFFRRIERINTQCTWNFIDNSNGNWTQYDGLVTHFENIKPPTRLNLYPYVSGIVNTDNGKTEFDWNAGLDIKYGLSENFTLDATLIPDFSQTGFDNIALNLGPFEQKLTEQRQFFTEGTDLFTKGDLFYSRRIGGSPITSAQLSDNEKLLESPEKVNMLNAVKISGRTKGGLGIGFFNAITEKTESIIENTLSNEKRKEVINPFSNYNIAVLDYQYNKNSSVTFINTNVYRKGNFRDANAAGLLWDIGTTNNQYSLNGTLQMTNITDVELPNTGYLLDFNIQKKAGNWFWKLGYSFKDKDFNPNDLSILYRNDTRTFSGNIGYRILQPTSLFNSYRIRVWNNARFQHHSGIFTENNTGLNIRTRLKNRLNLWLWTEYTTPAKDFYEPRQGNLSGIFYKQPAEISLWQGGSTNFQKKFAIEYSIHNNRYANSSKNRYGFNFKPRYRFNNKFSLQYGLKFRQTDNDRGYVEEQDDKIVFGQRNRTTYNNLITGKYSFSIKSSLSMTFRHNWTTVVYDQNYFALKDNGNLTPMDYKGTSNLNFNRWNFDLSYVWQFAPGSQLVTLYRNSINPNSDFADANINFIENADALFNENMAHSFSLKMVYFIDYNKL
ncbi:hypothetical protein EMN47_09825 [Prolixibacteraceae bacterium JC049]|nr:hypothetical protein [Prolixibacteraceae bacterium JC049]